LNSFEHLLLTFTNTEFRGPLQADENTRSSAARAPISGKIEQIPRSSPSKIDQSQVLRLRGDTIFEMKGIYVRRSEFGNGCIFVFQNHGR
jgi:hypothetical protein